MGFMDFLFGKKEKFKNKDLLGKESRQKLNDFFANPIEKSPLFSAGGNYLQQLLSGSPEAFSAFEKPYYENFEQNIAPGIAERFAGMGTGAGALNSSALTASLAQAGRGLQTDLASLRSGLQMQALPQALNYAQQPYTNTLQGTTADLNSRQMIHRPATSGFIQPLAQAGLTAAGTAFGGPLGGMAASGLSSALFNRQGQPGA